MSATLDDLATAVESPTSPDAAQWAHIDLFAALLGPNAVRPLKSRGIQRAPAILVFAPILVTWIGLFVGMYYYRATLNDAGMDGQGLLQRWQGGFGGHMPWFLSFDVFAALTVIAIVLLVTASLSTNVIEHRQAEELADLQHELHRALVEAETVLAPARHPVLGSLATDLGTIGSEIDRVAGILAATAAEIETVGAVARTAQQEAASALAEIGSATKSLGTASTAVQDAAGMAAEAATAVGGEIRSVSTAYDRLAEATTAVGRQVSESGDRVGSRLTEVAGDFSDRLHEAIDGNQQTFVSAMGSSTSQLATTFDKGVDELRDALGDLRTTGAAYTNRVENAGDVLGLAATSIGDLRTTAQRFHETLAAVHATETKISLVLGELKASIDAVGGSPQITAHQTLLTAITSLTGTVQRLHAELARTKPSPPPARTGLLGRLVGR